MDLIRAGSALLICGAMAMFTTIIIRDCRWGYWRGITKGVIIRACGMILFELTALLALHSGGMLP